MKKRKTLAGRITRRVLVWLFFIAIGLSFVLSRLEIQATRSFYSEIYRNKMLITTEYTRRVISDVYVAVTNNIYYLEHTLNDPDSHKLTMERIVGSGTRIRSCGISFIEDYYYAQKGQHRFCPFAWRNVTNPDEIFSEDMGDASLDYLPADWFRNTIESDSAQWSEPFYDGYDEKTTLAAYMVPIHDETGRAVAVLGADISLDWLTNKLQEADSTINDNATIAASTFKLKSNSFIINHDGTFITHLDNDRIMQDNIYDQIKPCDGSDAESLISMMKSGQEPTGKMNHKYIVDGEECYLFYTPIKYTKWLLVTIVPCRSIDLLCYLNAFSVVLIVLLAMLVVVVIGYYSLKNGIAPLKQLLRSASDMTKGRFDTPMPELKHNDEISQLRDVIEEMQFSLSNIVDDAKHSTDKVLN